MTKVEFTSIERLCSINFGSYDANPLYYAHHLYIGGSEVTDLVIPESVTSIGSYAFSGFTTLASIIFTNNVTTIGNEAFRGCSGLTSITIPESITTIGYEAFLGCTGLNSVTVAWKTPIKLNSSYAFPNADNTTLYVPIGTMSAYKSTGYWKNFKDIVEIIE